MGAAGPSLGIAIVGGFGLLIALALALVRYDAAVGARLPAARLRARRAGAGGRRVRDRDRRRARHGPLRPPQRPAVGATRCRPLPRDSTCSRAWRRSSPTAPRRSCGHRLPLAARVVDLRLRGLTQRRARMVLVLVAGAWRSCRRALDARALRPRSRAPRRCYGGTARAPRACSRTPTSTARSWSRRRSSCCRSCLEPRLLGGGRLLKLLCSQRPRRSASPLSFSRAAWLNLGVGVLVMLAVLPLRRGGGRARGRAAADARRLSGSPPGRP